MEEQRDDEQVATKAGDTEKGAGFCRRFLINQNPFYLISAALVLFGLSAGFGTDDVWINTTIPLTIMLTYAAVLSGIAVVLVRRGNVWEDLRSILLALGILFFNVSAGLDELLVREKHEATYTIVGVWLMVPALLELVRRGIGIRWPARFTIAVHLLLGLVLVYPALTARLLLAKQTELTNLSIAAFPVIAGVALLLLLPAVRQFAAGGWDNGTPWRRLELVVIAALPLALLTRAYLLATAFYPFPGTAIGGFHRLDTAFGGWFCVPILLASLALLLEVGIVRNSALWRRLAMLGAPALIPLALLGPDSAAYLALRDELTTSFASPALLTALAVMTFAGIAWLRRVPEAVVTLFAAILLLSPLGIDTVDLGSLRAPSWWSMTIASAGCFAALVHHRHSAWFLGGWLALVPAFASLLDFEGLRLTVAVTHLALIGMIIAATAFRDVFARATARALAAALPLLLLPAFWLESEAVAELAPGVRILYGLTIIGLCQLLRQQVHPNWFRIANYANLFHLGVFALAQLAVFLEHLELRGSGRIVAGVVALLAAVTISWLKARPAHE